MTVTLAEVNEQSARERRLDGDAVSTGRDRHRHFDGPRHRRRIYCQWRTIYSVTGDSTVMSDRNRDTVGDNMVPP